MPKANLLQWSKFRREGHESYARMAGSHAEGKFAPVEQI